MKILQEQMRIYLSGDQMLSDAISFSDFQLHAIAIHAMKAEAI